MRLNDHERELWVRNDEPLYRWWRSERMPIRRFIRECREEIDNVIRKRLGEEPSR